LATGTDVDSLAAAAVALGELVLVVVSQEIVVTDVAELAANNMAAAMMVLVAVVMDMVVEGDQAASNQ